VTVLSDKQRDTLRRRFAGDEKIDTLIYQLEANLGAIEHIRRQGTTIDTTIIDANDPETSELKRLKKQGCALLQTIDTLPDKARDILIHQWVMYWVDQNGSSQIDEPLAEIRYSVESLVEQAEIALAAHTKQPGRSRDRYREAQAYAVARAIRITYKCTFEVGSKGRKLFRRVLDVCLNGQTTDLAKKVLKMPVLGWRLPTNTRELRKAKPALGEFRKGKR